jgi:DNA mismatch endonuclease (patch repair protein)
MEHLRLGASTFGLSALETVKPGALVLSVEMTAVQPPTPERSRLMSRVRRRGTSAEIVVGRALRNLGAAYRKNVKALAGQPDFANRSARWAVFVNGCFWHRHTGCRRATLPKSNAVFWAAKLDLNRKRDAAAIRRLRAQGFTVAVVWECRLRGAEAQLGRLLKRASRRKWVLERGGEQRELGS